jgi:hypothetical protein
MYQTDEQVRARLQYWHEEKGMRWREIARLPDYIGINHATLNAIAHGRVVKDEWIRIRLGMEPDPRCVDCPAYDQYRERVMSKPARWDQYPVNILRLAIEYREEM